MTWRLPTLAGLALILTTAVTLAVDTSWIGEWNETGSMLGSSGVTGALFASLLLSVEARRNWRPLRSWHLPVPVWHWTRAWIRQIIAPVACSWLVLVVGTHAITVTIAPHPSSLSLLPLAAGTLFVLVSCTLGFLAGLLMHPAVALPLLAIVNFVVPAALGALEPSRAGNFTTSTSTSLAVGFAPIPMFYVRQCIFYIALIALLSLLSVATLRGRRSLPILGTAGVLVLSTGCWVGLSSSERIDDAHGLTSSACTTVDDGTEVCLVSDHERFLGQTADTVSRVTRALPKDARPARYIESGLPTRPGDLVLDTVNLRIDPMSQVIEDVSEWHTCEDEDTTTRSFWIADRAGLFDDDFATDELDHVLAMSDSEQLAWWRNGLHTTC